MKFLDRFKELLLENGLTISDVAQKTNIPRSTISSYVNRKSTPSAIQLEAIADFFNVSLDYLVGRSDDFGNVNVSLQPNGAELTNDEKTLLESFSLLGPFEREAILIQVQALAKKHETIKR